jgi:hypothetical protein
MCWRKRSLSESPLKVTGCADVTGYPAARPAWAGTTKDGGQLARLTRALGPSAERLLIGASVYREPADRNALLFQVGLHDWTAAGVPGRPGAEPPYQSRPTSEA